MTAPPGADAAASARDNMKRRWDALASRDAMHYIAARPESWTPREFFATGREVVEEVLAWAAPPGREHALDLGCGLGRTAVSLAAHFAHVDAVDISPVMIEKARRLDPPANVRFSVGTGEDLGGFEDGRFDFVFSVLVFQHIPQERVVGSYLAEVRRVLAPPGRAALQFDTRPSSLLSRLYERLPDALSGGTHRRFIRRYRRDPRRLRDLVTASGLAVVDERGVGGPGHYLLVERGPAS